MTAVSIAIDLVALLFVVALVGLEQRRGGARAGLDLGALLLTLVVLPMCIRPVISLGGGLLAMGIVACVLMVGALLASRWLGKSLQARSVNGEDVRSPSSRLAGGLVGLATAIVLVGSLGVLLVTMRLTSPGLASVMEGSLFVKAAARVEPTIRRILFEAETAPDPDPAVPSTPQATNDKVADGGAGKVEPGRDEEPSPARARARIEALAELRSIKAITDDPELMEAIEQRNYTVMLTHPKLLELWGDSRFRDFVAHVDTAELIADSRKLEQLATDYEAALVAFQTGDHEVALAAAERVVAEDPDYGHILILRGQLQKALGQLNRAALSWQEAAKRYTTAAEPAYLLGDLAVEHKEVARALAFYSEAIDRDPSFHYAVHNRGILLYEIGNYLPAVVDLRRALAIHPDDLELRLSLDGALVHLARESTTLVTSNRGNAKLWPSLYQWHRQLAVAIPDELMASNALVLVLYIGVTEHDMAERNAEALSEINRALGLVHDTDERTARELLAWRGILLLRAGEAAEAVSIFRPLLAAGRLHLVYSADIFTELAIHLAKHEDLDRARNLFGVAMGALQGTSYSTRLMREKYSRVDPDPEVPDRDELSEFVPGLRYVYRVAKAEVEYVRGESEAAEPARLEAGDVLLEIEFVAPLWPSEIRTLLLAAMREPPVTLTVERNGESLEILIQDGCRHLEWDTAWPFALPDDLP